jgi:hypothetical protein
MGAKRKLYLQKHAEAQRETRAQAGEAGREHEAERKRTERETKRKQAQRSKMRATVPYTPVSLLMKARRSSSSEQSEK